MTFRKQLATLTIRALAVATAALLMAHILSAAVDAGEKRISPTAEGFMIRAHQARAVWEDFPGFKADIVVSDNGSQLRGKLTVAADGKIHLDLSDAQAPQWVQRQLRSLVMHRRAGRTRKYDVEFADKSTHHPLGRLIKLNGDLMGSVYRIKGDVITEVHRTMGGAKFTISVFEVTRNAEGKYLPKTYSVSFWDAKTGNLKNSSTSYNAWTRVGHFDLPAKLLSVSTGNDGKRNVRQIEFKNHKLAARTAASAK